MVLLIKLSITNDSPPLPLCSVRFRRLIRYMYIYTSYANVRVACSQSPNARNIATSKRIDERKLFCKVFGESPFRLFRFAVRKTGISSLPIISLRCSLTYDTILCALARARNKSRTYAEAVTRLYLARFFHRRRITTSARLRAHCDQERERSFASCMRCRDEVTR